MPDEPLVLLAAADGGERLLEVARQEDPAGGREHPRADHEGAVQLEETQQVKSLARIMPVWASNDAIWEHCLGFFFFFIWVIWVLCHLELELRCSRRDVRLAECDGLPGPHPVAVPDDLAVLHGALGQQDVVPWDRQEQTDVMKPATKLLRKKNSFEKSTGKKMSSIVKVN